jgi:hypothetical protein
MERLSLQRKHDVTQPFIIEKKQKKIESENKDAPRTTHSI